jgi:hypothetical protein
VHVWCDNTLCMQKLMSSVSRTCYKQLHNIGRIRSLITDDTCKTLARALVTSRLDYASALLCGINKLTWLNYRKYKTWLHGSSLEPRETNTTPVLKSVYWLPMEMRIDFKILLYTYKVIHEMAPQYLEEVIAVYRPQRSLRSENSVTLVKPRSQTSTYGKGRLDVAAARLCGILYQITSVPVRV